MIAAVVACDRCWAHGIEVIGTRGCRRELVAARGWWRCKGFAVGFGRGLGVLMWAFVGFVSGIWVGFDVGCWGFWFWVGWVLIWVFFFFFWVVEDMVVV